MTVPTYTSEIVDAAMCIWESALHGCPEDDRALAWLQAGEGAATGRDNALTLAPFAEHAWKIAQKLGYDEGFDWEFVPRFIARAMVAESAPCYLTYVRASEIGRAIYEEITQ